MDMLHHRMFLDLFIVPSHVQVPDIYAPQTHTFGGEMLNQHFGIDISSRSSDIVPVF